MECVIIGWIYSPAQVLKQVNRNTGRYRMPGWWFVGGIRYLAPFLLAAFLGWQMSGMIQNGLRYESYPLYAQAVGGWLVSGLVLFSGFIVNGLRKNLAAIVKKG